MKRDVALTWKRGLPFQHDGDVFEGTLAGRPAAAAASNAIYFATDNGIAYYSNGAAWSVVPFSTIDAAAVPDLSGTYQVRSERAAASGYASLDAGTKVPSAQLGSGGGGAGTKVLYDDQTFKTPGAAGVSSLAKSGSAQLTGDVTLTGGTNVTLTQAGQDISIAASGSASDWTTVTKAADESVTSSTTLQNDDELFFTAAASGVYEVEGALIYGSPAGAGTPDFKIGLGEDATTRGIFVALAFFTTADALTGASGGAAANQVANLAVGTAAANRLLKVVGSYVGNGGTFRLLWAQNTSSASATILRAGSVLRYRQLA